MAMAFSSKLQLLLVSFFLTSPLSFSNPDDPSILKSSVQDVHDLLSQYNLPKGLIPRNVKSYSLSPEDNTFTIELPDACYVQFTDLVYYHKILTGTLGYGQITNLSGIEVTKLFAWLPITGIQVYVSSENIELQVGFLSEKLPVSLFQNIPSCRNSWFPEQYLLASM